MELYTLCSRIVSHIPLYLISTTFFYVLKKLEVRGLLFRLICLYLIIIGIKLPVFQILCFIHQYEELQECCIQTIYLYEMRFWCFMRFARNNVYHVSQVMHHGLHQKWDHEGIRRVGYMARGKQIEAEASEKLFQTA